MGEVGETDLAQSSNGDRSSGEEKRKTEDQNLEINIFDEREIYYNCTVEVWHNSITDEYSIGWWQNDSGDNSCGGDCNDSGFWNDSECRSE